MEGEQIKEEEDILDIAKRRLQVRLFRNSLLMFLTAGQALPRIM